MRRIRYQVACSLDGFIATENGEYDWLPTDPEMDFSALMEQFDTLLMGRKTYETLLQSGNSFEKELVVLSNSLRPEDHPRTSILSGDVRPAIEKLREEEGKDIWLFGGGETFRSLLEVDLVDSVELAVVPVLLGGGIPFLSSPAERAALQLRRHQVFSTSGIVLLEYDVKKR